MAGCSLSRQAWRACGVPPVTPAPVRRVPLRKSRQRSSWDHFRWSASTRADEEVPQELRRILLVCLCESSRSQPSPTPGIAVGSTWKKVRHSPAPSIPPSSAAPPRPHALVERLVSHGVVCGYVYDPPLDDYAGAELVQPSPDGRRPLVGLARASGPPAPGPPDYQRPEKGTGVHRASLAPSSRRGHHTTGIAGPHCNETS
jgi:hypothetical protein